MKDPARNTRQFYTNELNPYQPKINVPFSQCLSAPCEEEAKDGKYGPDCLTEEEIPVKRSRLTAFSGSHFDVE
jgi:hypothetical protein